MPADGVLCVDADKAVSDIDIFSQEGQLLKTATIKEIQIDDLASDFCFVRIVVADNIGIVDKLIKYY